MRNSTASASSATSVAFAPAAADRRSKARLRELCDEVLASFRIASDRDLFSAQDRAEGHALLTRIAPLARA